MKFNLKSIAFGLLISFVFLSFVPQTVHGFALDLASNQLDAISERAGPIATILFYALLFFAIGRLLLSVTTSLLYSIMVSTPSALTVTTAGASEFVQKGWAFSLGIVNMIMIIAFMVIAFAVILGSEKIQLKKALPNLIIVALLVNFTLVFVGAGIDVSNFVYNSILNQFQSVGGGGNVISNAITPLFDFGGTQIGVTIAYLVTSSAALLVPYLNVATQFAWVVAIPILFDTALKFLVYGGIMWILSGLFFLYFLIFLIRIFVIQILAILAPIAFFCLIFDGTKKYWKQWLDNLMQWLFVGVIFIFLMYFGLAMAPTVTSMASGIAGENVWAAEILGYFALLSYFIVIAGMTKKLAPAAVGMVIDQAKGFAKMVTPFAAGIALGAATRMRGNEAKRQEEIKEREERAKTEPTNFLTRARTSGMKAQSWAIRRAHNVAGTTVSQESKKDVSKKVEAMKKKYGDDGHEEFLKNYIPGTRTDNLSSDVAALQYLSSGGADALTKVNPRVLGNMLEVANRRGDSKTVKNAIKHIPDYGDISQREQDLQEIKDRIRTEIEAENPNMSQAEVDDAVSRNKEVKTAENKRRLAERVQTIMTADARKADSGIADAEKELETTEEELANAINSADQTLENEARAKKARLEKEIEDRTRDAIYKISVLSLKAKDIENLSSSTLKNKSFLTSVAKNKNMSFIRMFEERKDAPEIIGQLEEQLNNIGVQELETANPTFYNQIKKTPAGQSLFGNFHKAIETHEQTKTTAARLAAVTESITQKEALLSEKRRSLIASTGAQYDRIKREVENIEKEISDLRRGV